MASFIYHLKYPFKRDLGLLFILFLLLSFTELHHQLMQHAFVYAVYVFMMYFVLAYLFVLVFNINRIIRLWLSPVFLFALLMYSVLNETCFVLFGVQINGDIASIIAGTNLSEVWEFIQAYVTFPMMLLTVSLVFCIVGFYIYYTYRPIILNEKIVFVLIAFLVICVSSCVYNPGVINSISNNNRWNFQFDEVVDLTKHSRVPEIEENDLVHPIKVVIIIGESHSKSHSQLYGYSIDNEPLLTEMYTNDDLLVFKNVKSPATYTTESFKYILNTHILGEDDKWYESYNIIDVYKKLGYKSRWISNQHSVGMWDNIASSFSKLCDECFFSEDEDEDLDEYCLKFIEEDVSSPDKTLSIYHLMGMHEDFKERYPNSYDFFNEALYLQHPINQRSDRAAYDNATLYNDFIVSSIMRSYENSDAVCIYFPDHGLDLFDSSDDYRGHARLGYKESVEASLQIPCFIYLSPAYQIKNPHLKDAIAGILDMPFTTDRLIYLLTEVSGYRLSDINKSEFLSIKD